MNPEQYLRRFEKKFGAVEPSKSGLPLALGSEHREFGISFRPAEVIKPMFERYNSKYGKANVQLVKAWDCFPEVEYKSDAGSQIKIVSFPTQILKAGVGVLENSPYIHCTAIRTDTILPIVFQRDSVAIFVAPSTWTINPNNNYPIPDNHNIYKRIEEEQEKIEWVSPIYNTSFWNVIFHPISNPHWQQMTWDGEKAIKCRSCGFTISTADYIVKVLNNHPDCHCNCLCQDCRQVRYHFQRLENMKYYERRKWE